MITLVVDVAAPDLRIAYLAAGHEVTGVLLDGPALVLSDSDGTYLFGRTTPQNLLGFFRAAVRTLEAGPEAPPLLCGECGDPTPAVSAAGRCKDCETEAAMAVAS